ncbi:MAG TPA: sugar ABC transporter permease [Chloroflexota bacterium]|nr:sugar ABC transporter permease [Chloroflexota bacterium]
MVDLPASVARRDQRFGSRLIGLSRLSAGQQENFYGYLFLLPWFVGMVAITIGPILASLALAFTDYSIMAAPRWVGLANFVTMFTGDARYFSAVRTTLAYVGMSVPLVLIWGLALALLLNQGLKFLPVFRAIFYIPSLLGSSVAVAILWFYMFGKDGLINLALRPLGIQGPSYIGNPSYALYTLIVLNLWAFGSGMIIFLAGLRQIPTELYEAAQLDGAGAWAKFWRVTLPLLTPVLFFNAVLGLVGGLQAFTSAYVVSNGTGGPADATLLYQVYLYQRGFVNLNMGYACAMAWVLLTVVAVCTGFLFWSARFWVFYGEDR